MRCARATLRRNCRFRSTGASRGRGFRAALAMNDPLKRSDLLVVGVPYIDIEFMKAGCPQLETFGSVRPSSWKLNSDRGLFYRGDCLFEERLGPVPGQVHVSR